MDNRKLEELLAAMLQAGGTSLHLIPGRVPCARVQRRFTACAHPALQAADVEELTRDLLFEDHRERLRRHGQVDVLYVARSGKRFRTTVLLQEGGQSVLLRPVPDHPPVLGELELPAQMSSLAQFRSGLVLITGFFGAGKSTTLSALVERMNQEPMRNIVTIEDPIEHLHPVGRALLHQREVGVHVASFADGVAEAVRIGADVIVVSDVPDAATMDALFAATEAGCMVLAAFDASSVVGAMNALMGLYLPEHRARARTRLAGGLRAVAAQSMLPRANRPGRVPVVEILINNLAVRSALRQGAFGELHGIMQRCRGLGMQTADTAIKHLLARGAITSEVALHHAMDRDQVAVRTPAAPVR